MQFRKTQKNKKRFRGGNFLIDYTTDLVRIIKDNSPGTVFDSVQQYCVSGDIGCRENFLNILKEPSNLALAGISIASYAAYLLYGTRKKQDEILQKIEKIKKERRESEESSEESSDSTDHSDSKYDDSSLSDEGDEDMDVSNSQKTYKQSYKKIEDKQKIINDLVGRSKGRSKGRKSNRKSAGRRR